MVPGPPATGPGGPCGQHLADNVLHFARLLRAAGLAIGTDRVVVAQQALRLAGLESRAEFHAVLSACLLDRIEHRPLFDQAFELFWREPDLVQRLQAGQAPQARPQPGAEAESRRLGEAFFGPARQQANAEPATNVPPAGTQLSWAETEQLRLADFDSMSVDEWRAAQRLLAKMRLITEPLPTRRQHPAARPGQPDWRASLRAAARSGGELVSPRWRAPRSQRAPLVLLADISGSMSRYSRVLLHFAHGLAQASRTGGKGEGAKVESFVFGTRLTRTTRLLASRDPDLAVAQVVRAVQDWSGGTRITTSLHDFNQHWARRVLNSRATVLLVSDGLEHGDTAALAFEMARLRLSCRRLVWLNPLLRFAQFEPRAGGIRAMLPHVDRFLPAHNLNSLAELVRLLSEPGGGRRPPPTPATPVTPRSRGDARANPGIKSGQLHF